MPNQLIILLNEAEYCSCVIFLENYLNEISQNRMKETTVKKCEYLHYGLMRE